MDWLKMTDYILLIIAILVFFIYPLCLFTKDKIEDFKYNKKHKGSETNSERKK